MKKFFALFTVIALLAVTGSAFAANPVEVTADPSYFSIKAGETTSLTSTVSATAANSGDITDYAVTGESATISGKTVTIPAPATAGTHKVTVRVTETYYESDDVGHINPQYARETVTIIVNVIETGSEETGGTFTVTAESLTKLVAKLGSKYANMKSIPLSALTDSSYSSFEEVEAAFNEKFKEIKTTADQEINAQIDAKYNGLVQDEFDKAIDKFISEVGKAYKEKIGYAADFYVVEIGSGPYEL